MTMWLPEYERVVVSTGRTGETPRAPEECSKIGLHCTDGLRTYDYPYPPHFTLGLVGNPGSLPPGTYWFPDGYRRVEAGDRIMLQHCDLGLTSYAWLHRHSDPETNHSGRHNIQVEIISRASAPDTWNDEMYDFVAGWLADVVEAVPALLPALDNFVAPNQWTETGSWGFDAWTRMTWDEWQHGINGQEMVPFLCGHEHVPGNAHWDPGALDIVKLTTMAKAKLALTCEEKLVICRERVRRLRARVSTLEARLEACKATVERLRSP